MGISSETLRSSSKTRAAGRELVGDLSGLVGVSRRLLREGRHNGGVPVRPIPSNLFWKRELFKAGWYRSDKTHFWESQAIVSGAEQGLERAEGRGLVKSWWPLDDWLWKLGVLTCDPLSLQILTLDSWLWNPNLLLMLKRVKLFNSLTVTESLTDWLNMN